MLNIYTIYYIYYSIYDETNASDTQTYTPKIDTTRPIHIRIQMFNTTKLCTIHYIICVSTLCTWLGESSSAHTTATFCASELSHEVCSTMIRD